MYLHQHRCWCRYCFMGENCHWTAPAVTHAAVGRGKKAVPPAVCALGHDDHRRRRSATSATVPAKSTTRHCVLSCGCSTCLPVLNFLLAAILQTNVGLKVNVTLSCVRTRRNRNNKNNLVAGTSPSPSFIMLISGSARGPFSFASKESRTGFDVKGGGKP